MFELHNSNAFHVIRAANATDEFENTKPLDTNINAYIDICS